MRLEMNSKHFLFSLVFSVFWGQIVSGQQVTEPERPPAAESQQESDADVLKEQIIYVPYEKLPQVFEKPARGVFLPYDQFQ